MLALFRNHRRLRLVSASFSSIAALTSCGETITTPAVRVPIEATVAGGAATVITVETALPNGGSMSLSRSWSRAAQTASTNDSAPRRFAMASLLPLGMRIGARDTSIAHRGLMRTAAVVDSATGKRTWVKQLRSIAGAPPDRFEYVSNGVALHATKFIWRRDGESYVLDAIVTEFYSADTVALRLTFSQAQSDAKTPVVTHASQTSRRLSSVIRSKQLARAMFRRASVQDLCDTHDCPLIARKVRTARPDRAAPSGPSADEEMFCLADSKPCAAEASAFRADAALAFILFWVAGANAVATYGTAGLMLPAEITAVEAFLASVAAELLDYRAWQTCMSNHPRT